jgi:amino acid transporter
VSEAVERRGFSTFSGVFRPISLTILGAMLYLREGWLVGNNGLLGALLVIGAAYAITGTTSLALSSIATNVRVTAGGPFAIVSRALGLEAGGSIGVPLYVAQSLSSALYLYAFAEGWNVLFPSHDQRVVAVLAFLVVGTVALLSAQLASRAQAVMFVVIGVALTSALTGIATVEVVQTPNLVGRFTDVSMLESFAIFFPAATGIMVGAGMSGELTNARRALPRGTLGAWAATGAIYVVFALWYSLVGTTEELLATKTLMVDRAAVGWMVLVGLLASTLMAALSSLVAAPRLLQAMATFRVVPGSDWLGALTKAGEPRNATLVTLGLAALGLASGSLDAIAPILTGCFLITYLALNAVVFLEQRLGMVSFRPTFEVPHWVPAVGMLVCIVALGLTSPGGGLLEVIGVVGLYAWLALRRLDTPWETVHSGLALNVAARLAKWAARLERSQRSWKPDLLVPVGDIATLELLRPVASLATAVQGSVKYTAITDDPDLPGALDLEIARLRAQERFASWHAMPADGPDGMGVKLMMNAMKGTFFASNLLLLGDRMPDAQLQGLRDHAVGLGIGVALLLPGPDGPPHEGSAINVWLSDRSPDWHIGLHVVNTDLPVLLAWLMTRPSRGQVRLFVCVRDPAEAQNAHTFLTELIAQGRLPPNTMPHVTTKPFMEALGSAPPADLTLFGLAPTISLERFTQLRDATGGSCLFLQDSGQETLLA